MKNIYATQKNDLEDQLATLETRLEKGWTMTGDAVDDLFVKLLAEYERIYDELKADVRV